MIRESVLNLEMPYEPQLSINQIHYRGNMRCKFKPKAEKWLEDFEGILDNFIKDRKPAVGEVVLDLGLRKPLGRGRRPDTSNFRKYIQDTVAGCLGIDDSVFSGTDTAVVDGKTDAIIVSIYWKYEVKQAANKPTQIKSRLCLGYNTNYCTKCEDITCPYGYEPGTAEHCERCLVLDCPCKTGERNSRVKLWLDKQEEE